MIKSVYARIWRFIAADDIPDIEPTDDRETAQHRSNDDGHQEIPKISSPRQPSADSGFDVGCWR